MEKKQSTIPPLYKYQQEGILQLSNFLSNSVDNAALLADPPGAGKTPQAILTAAELQCERVIVVCPASLRENWRREFTKWGNIAAEDIQVIASGADTLDASKRVTILSYTLAINPKIIKQYEQLNFDMLVCDESHYLKNPSSQTSRIILILLWSRCRYRILISGTPLPNGRASEAWTTFSRLLSSQFGKWSEFCDRYCLPSDTPWGIKYYRSKNLDELQRIARDSFMVRRTKAEVLGELPPLVRQNIYIDVAPKDLFDIEDGLDIEGIVNAIDNGLPLESDHISTARQKLGVLKSYRALDHVLGLLDEVGQVVVFCHHRTPWQVLYDGFQDHDVAVVGINGTMSSQERQAAVDAFQQKKAQVFVASLRAANTGITLTAASTLVMVEYDWVPSTNEQAEGRIYRVTQDEISRVHYLVVADSLDERVLAVVQRKQREILKAIN